jgi:hypothetical protein
MAVNKAEQDLESRFIREFSALKAEFLQFKTRQPIGGDILKVKAYPDFADDPLIVGPIFVPSKSTRTTTFTITPGQATLTIVNPLFTLYQDAVATGFNYPTGAFIDEMSFWIQDDLYGFNPSTNSHKFVASIFNNDAVDDHDYYITARLLIPQLDGTA